MKWSNYNAIASILVCWVVMFSCKEDNPLPPLGTMPEQLTLNSGKDEDPTVLQARDGSFYVAWFSDRDGNPEIWMTRTADGIIWEEPWKITNDPAEDLYPQLTESRSGGFYLTWFHIAFDATLQQFTFHIWFAKSIDGKIWTDHKQLSESASTFNWVPSIMEDSNGRIWIAYTSGRLDLNKEIYLQYSDDKGATWNMEPVRVTTSALADDFPFIIQSKSGTYLIAWARYNDSLGLFNPTSENMLATSTDGLTWSSPQVVSPADLSATITDTLPHLFSEINGNGVFMVWTSDRGGNGGNIFSAPLPSATGSTVLVQRTANGKAYSGRMIPTSLGKYLMVWVSTENAATQPDIFYQFVD